MPGTVEELIDSGLLAEAIRGQTEVVRAKPVDREARFLLFTLISFAGDLERAEKQLEALGVGSGPTVEMQTLLYRSLLSSEAHRREVWTGRARPFLAPDAPATLSKRADALGRLAAGDAAGASQWVDEANAEAVAVSGTLNGEPFEQLRDSDDIAASLLEVFAQGHCLWLSIEQIRTLEVQKPETLVDLLWPRARLLDARGNDALVHVPALYAGSYEHSDGKHRVGRVTSWEEIPEVGLVRGVGQKLWLALHRGEERECALLDVRSLSVDG